MTRHKATQTGLGTPSPLDRWINALLRGLAMLVSHVARRFVSRNQTSAAECDGNCDRLPEANVVLDQHQELTPAAASSPPIEALMVSSTRSVRPSNHGERRRRRRDLVRGTKSRSERPGRGKGSQSSQRVILGLVPRISVVAAEELSRIPTAFQQRFPGCASLTRE